MRRSASDHRATGALACGAIALAWLACAPPPAPQVAEPSPAPSVVAAAAPPLAGPGRRPGSLQLAPLEDAPRDFVLQPVPGGRSVLAVSQHADEHAAWARRLSEDGMGPLLRFMDQHVVGAFDHGDGSTTYVTSDGTRLCFGPSARSEDRSCVESNPVALVSVGDRLALLELAVAHPPAPKSAHPPSRPAPKPRSKSKESKPAKGAGKNSKKKHTSGGAAHRPSHPLVELFVRWVEPDGAASPEATSTGLHFEAPLDGMTLVDARARPPGIDVLWYETAPGRKTKAPLGSGRLMAASLRADGTLDFGSRVAVADADVEYGLLKDHHGPRLVGDDQATVYLGLDGKGQCEALRVLPTLARLTASPGVCALAPDLLAGAVDPAMTAALERIADDHPRRAQGQPKSDLGLVAWAGTRGYYLQKDRLRSASLAGGPPRDEPPPFPARRAPISWGAMESDGEWAAVASLPVHARRGSAPDYGSPPALPAQWAASLPDLPSDRRRAARIGATWWTARGPRVRLWPQDSAAPGPGAADRPDTSVLVGGPEHGLSLDLAGGDLVVSAVDADGTRRPLTTISPSPVAPGFDACPRAAGGAIVAGALPGHPRRLVTFTVDPSGHAGPPLSVPADTPHDMLAVRLTPLPAGGAIFSELDHRVVRWLDDNAGLLTTAEQPRDESDAACPYGRPMPLSVPSFEPGSFTKVPGVEKDTCLVGDPTWTRTGEICWFGGTAEALDFSPELTCLPLATSIPAPSFAPLLVLPDVPDAGAPRPAPPPEGARACPPDMVSVAGRFCVDRFESMIVDTRSFAPLSPDYPTTPNLLDFVLGEWSTGRERAGNVHARAFPLPWISPSRLGDTPPPLAVSRVGVRPNGYLSGVVAASACAAAGKRLCTLDEFVTACRGQDDTLFPYGDTYEDGVCNVFREDHPAALLHGNASVGHLDPRLSRVLSHGRPLLQTTGGSPACRSRWGDDAIYDMVGNLDEWVDEGGGAFAGGFYSRSTRNGCEALVTAHPKTYLDYSTGARCCKDPG